VRTVHRFSNGLEAFIQHGPKQVKDRVYQQASIQWGGSKIQKTHPHDASIAIKKLVEAIEEKIDSNLVFTNRARLDPIDRQPGRSFQEWAEDCVQDVERAAKAERKSESYAELLRTFLDKHIKGTSFGKADIKTINHPKLVLAFIDEARAKPYYRGKNLVGAHSSQWAALLRRFLSKVFNYARDYDPTIPQPVTDKTRFDVEHEYKELFTVEEMEKLLKTARTPSERVILALGFWGVRPSEICATRWSKLSADGLTLRLDKQIKRTKQDGKQAEFVERKPKTQSSRRTIQLDPEHFVYRVLQEAKAQADPEQDFICVQTVTNPRTRKTVTRTWTAPDITKLVPHLCKLAEIPIRNSYVMKATAITMMFLNGVDMNTVSAITGVSTTTLLKHYDRAQKLERQKGALPKFNLKVA
jgi:integrase